MLLLIACNTANKKTDAKERTPEEQAIFDRKLDSMTNDIKKDLNESMSDTTGIHKAPVQVIKARFIEQEYSNYKDMQLTYKNVSGKDIEAIRFKWTGVNAFGEPADLGATFGDIGAGFTDNRLRAGRTTSSIWTILSRDGKKVTKAWAYEVVFVDGTKWEFTPNQ